MKRVLLVILVLAFCIPASAELVIYKITCRERLVDQYQDCPAKEVLTETMRLIIDVDPNELALLECGGIAALYGDAISDAAIFKTWKLGRQKLYGYEDVEDMVAYVLDKHVCIQTQYCNATCVMFGPMSRIGLPRVLVGHVTLDGVEVQYAGEGTCSARLDTRLMRTAQKQGLTTVGEMLDYLLLDQSEKALEGDVCDPLNDEIDS